MNNTIYILLFLITLVCFGQEKAVQNELRIIFEEIGDLDNDGIEEKVIVYETNDLTDSGNVRELCIFKFKNGEWIDLIRTRNAILKSKEGGAMGDPFEDVQIKNGVLNISFYGGSNSKWAYTDKYKFQDNQFKLIGYTSTNFKLCDYWESVDFNLLTGEVNVKNGYEKCENQEQKNYETEIETFYKKGIHITLQNRQPKEMKIVTPKHGRVFYL